MTLASLTPEERDVIRRTLEATFRFFDFDFHTRLGVSPDAMRAILDAWPAIDDSHDDSDASLAINNSLNDLLHGVGISDSDAVKFLGVNRAELLGIYERWAASCGRRGVQ